MSSSNKGNVYNGQPPKYLNDFSKALAGEVRILLAEVGQLRDERRQLQHEIAELMSVKSKFGAGGEYTPEWHPGQSAPPPPPEPAPAEDAGPPAPARPAWRTVNKRSERKARTTPKEGPKLIEAGGAKIEAPAPKPGLPAWAQWRPNPLLSPAPGAGTPPTAAVAAPPDRSGLFGPDTPPPK